MTTKTSTVSKHSKMIIPERYCLVSFPSEGTHGIWPESLIRTKGQFGFEAKFGKNWFECRVETEGIVYLLVIYKYVLFFILKVQKKSAKRHQIY